MPEEKKIEILRAGKHTSSDGRSHTFTEKDLKEIVETYDPQNFKAPLIVSHDTKDIPDDKLINSEFAFGAPKRLELVGNRVKAVFEQIAPEFVGWVREGKLLSVSPSIYLRESPNNPTPGKLSLRHIAGLGKNPPAIKGMEPLALQEGLACFSTPVSEAVDFMNMGVSFGQSAIASLFRKLRESCIEKDGLEAANQVIPEDLLSIIENSGLATSFDVQMLNARCEEMQRRMDEMCACEDKPYYSYGEPEFMDLKKAMKDKGMSMADVAAETGISIEDLTKVAAGEMDPPAKLKKLLGMEEELEMGEKKKAMSYEEMEAKIAELKAKEEALLNKEAELNAKEQENAAFAEQVRRTQVNTLVDGFAHSGVIRATEKPQIVSFMMALKDDQVLEFGEGDEAKKQSPLECFTEIMNGRAKVVNPALFREVAPGADPVVFERETRANYSLDFDEQSEKDDAAIKAYMAEHNVEYAEAAFQLNITY